MQIELFTAEHLEQVIDLINLHLSAMVPGWGLGPDYLMKYLQRNPGEYVIDPWVIERKTLCAVQRGRVIGATHLLRYGAEPAVSDFYHHAVDIGWLLFWPDEGQAAAPLMTAAREQAVAWQAARLSGWDNSLPMPLCSGIPDCWPHVQEIFESAGFTATEGRRESIFGGWLRDVPLPGVPPIPGMTLRRILHHDRGVGFIGMLDGQEIGWCDVQPNLTEGDERPLLRGWAEMGEMYVDEAWRDNGVGAWLVQHAVEWLRLAACDRIALTVTAEDEANGAGRFYNRFGWNNFARLEVGWTCTDFTPA